MSSAIKKILGYILMYLGLISIGTGLTWILVIETLSDFGIIIVVILIGSVFTYAGIQLYDNNIDTMIPLHKNVNESITALQIISVTNRLRDDVLGLLRISIIAIAIIGGLGIQMSLYYFIDRDIFGVLLGVPLLILSLFVTYFTLRLRIRHKDLSNALDSFFNEIENQENPS